jgi:hypothetical protein
MNASVTMRQARQSKKMAEARFSFEELRITILKHCGPVTQICVFALQL